MFCVKMSIVDWFEHEVLRRILDNGMCVLMFLVYLYVVIRKDNVLAFQVSRYIWCSCAKIKPSQISANRHPCARQDITLDIDRMSVVLKRNCWALLIFFP